MPVVNYGNNGVSPRTTLYAAREMLKHARPVMVLEKLGLVTPIPRNSSMTQVFRRPRVFEAVTVPLTEGVTPASRTFRYDDVTVTLKQYGEVVEITDVIEDTHEDPVLRDASAAAGENVGRTKEALIYAVLCGGTNAFFANGVQRSDVNTPITIDRHMGVMRALKAQKAEPITNILDGSINFNTTPIERGFVAVAHTDLEYNLRALPGFVPISEYGQRSTISEHEIGAVSDCRYILSPDLGPFVNAGGAAGVMQSTGGTLADVYPVLYFGREAFANVPLRGEGSIEPTIIPPGLKTKSDPLGQRGYVGWKMWFAAVILNDLWRARLEGAVTDL